MTSRHNPNSTSFKSCSAMITKLYTIELTQREAQLCRIAAKAFHREDAANRSSDRLSDYIVSKGRQTLRRELWSDLQKWLSWAATDFEQQRSQSERRLGEAISERIEFALDEPDQIVEESEPKPAGCLF